MDSWSWDFYKGSFSYIIFLNIRKKISPPPPEVKCSILDSFWWLPPILSNFPNLFSTNCCASISRWLPCLYQKRHCHQDHFEVLLTTGIHFPVSAQGPRLFKFTTVFIPDNHRIWHIQTQVHLSQVEEGCHSLDSK